MRRIYNDCDFFILFHLRFLLEFQQRESKWAIKSSVVPFSVENTTERYTAITYCIEALASYWIWW